MSDNFGKIELVLKGGQPWGFKLRANSNKRSSVIVDEIIFGGKAYQQGRLKVGDHLLKINGIQCLSLADAHQLIDSAFRTLTILALRVSESFEDDLYLAPNSLQKCVQKSNYVPCKPFYKCFSTLSIYKNSNNVTNEEQLLSSEEKSTVETNACKNTMKTLQSSISTYSNNCQISANKMTVFCASNYSSLKNSESSNLIPECCKDSKNIHYCNEKPSLSLKEMYLKDIPHMENMLNSTNSPYISKHNVRLNSVVSHCNQSLISSIQIEKSAVFSKTFSENTYCSKNEVSASKSIDYCCMYPNCYNEHINCKIHCLPERDIAHTTDQLIKNNKCNSDLLHDPLSESKCRNEMDILPIKNNPAVNNSGSMSCGYLVNENLMLHENITLKNAELLDLNHQFNIPSSNIQTQFELKNVTASSVSEPVTNSQSMHLKREDQHSSSQNHFSFCYFDDIFHKNLHAKSESSLSPNYVNIDDLQKDVIFNHLPQNSSVQVNETNKHTFHFCTKSSLTPTSSMKKNKQTFLNCEQFDVPHNSSANENFIRKISSEAEEDEEICLIEKNKVSCHTTSPSSSVIRTPPLPSPPLETEIEICASDVTLPPPPFFFNENDCSKASKMGAITETIYENLEMVQLQCSVVNSSNQTNLDKQTHFFTESSEVTQNRSLQIKEASPYSERKDTSSRKCIPSKLQRSTFFMKSMLPDQSDKCSKNSLSLPFTSAYFTTSTPKAKFLANYTSKVHLKNEPIGKELSNKKEKLMSSITSKVDILLQEQASLQEEIKQNDELGCSLATKLEKCAKLKEVGKFKVHVEELGKITNLLLLLSGRLARTKSALLIFPSDVATDEKILLEEKLDKLNQQYKEAMYLQENINQRSNQISFIMNKYLTGEECADYKHFIKMKVKLLMDYKELVEKIKLGKEQLSALRSSIKTMDVY